MSALKNPKRAAMFWWLRLWALPTTLLGVSAGLLWLLLGAKMRVVHGVIEVHGGWFSRRKEQQSRFAAITLGHVILGRSSVVLEQLRPHEHVHVRQAERWGIFFIPAYLLAGFWQILKGRHAYYDNPFEREAFAVELSAMQGCPEQADRQL